MIPAVSLVSANTNHRVFGRKTGVTSPSQVISFGGLPKNHQKICKDISSEKFFTRVFGHIKRVVYNIRSEDTIVTANGQIIPKHNPLHGL